VAIVFAVLLGVPLGIGAALKPGSKLDQGLATFALLGLSLPQFWLGAMLILLFSVQLGWFPTSGMGGIEHIVLPALTLGLPSLGRIAQITRTSMIDELSSQHILTARAKGLSGRYLITRHALRNVMVPIATIVSWETAYTLAGYSVIVETVFAWPGLGYLAIQAIQREDLILIQGIVIVVAAIVVLINIVTDILYTAIDPRIELK
jgi:peptide/nickel transport system permease protein